MSDPQEIAALKASFRGALHAAESLAALRDRIGSVDAGSAIAPADLEEIARVTAANAIAAAALRGLVETMMARRAASAE